MANCHTKYDPEPSCSLFLWSPMLSQIQTGQLLLTHMPASKGCQDSLVTRQCYLPPGPSVMLCNPWGPSPSLPQAFPNFFSSLFPYHLYPYTPKVTVSSFFETIKVTKWQCLQCPAPYKDLHPSHPSLLFWSLLKESPSILQSSPPQGLTLPTRLSPSVYWSGPDKFTRLGCDTTHSVTSCSSLKWTKVNQQTLHIRASPTRNHCQALTSSPLEANSLRRINHSNLPRTILGLVLSLRKPLSPGHLGWLVILTSISPLVFL